MVKGVSIKFKSYAETLPKLLQLTKFENELKKHSMIILKPALRNSQSAATSVEFVEPILQYCLAHKNPDAQVLIAEGSDGEDTQDLFEKQGYRRLAERYSVGLIDLNTAEVEEVRDGEFLKFESIKYPKLLLNSFIVSLPKLAADAEVEMSGALSNMLGAFPADHYQSWFAKKKNKIRRESLKYAIHDILRCKMPDTAIIDASEQGMIFLGHPLEIDKQAAKLVKGDWKHIQHLRLVDESFAKELAAPMPEQKAKA
ncbi:DUF362 domain-containing protein [Candidatus Pacearchaeota archaeon]|nr:DUF362 domain-containing protein [Candidatus Pacearchaeota archaeon]